MRGPLPLTICFPISDIHVVYTGVKGAVPVVFGFKNEILNCVFIFSTELAYFNQCVGLISTIYQLFTGFLSRIGRPKQIEVREAKV